MTFSLCGYSWIFVASKLSDILIFKNLLRVALFLEDLELAGFKSETPEVSVYFWKAALISMTCSTNIFMLCPFNSLPSNRILLKKKHCG